MESANTNNYHQYHKMMDSNNRRNSDSGSLPMDYHQRQRHLNFMMNTSAAGAAVSVPSSSHASGYYGPLPSSINGLLDSYRTRHPPRTSIGTGYPMIDTPFSSRELYHTADRLGLNYDSRLYHQHQHQHQQQYHHEDHPNFRENLLRSSAIVSSTTPNSPTLSVSDLKKPTIGTDSVIPMVSPICNPTTTRSIHVPSDVPKRASPLRKKKRTDVSIDDEDISNVDDVIGGEKKESLADAPAAADDDDDGNELLWLKREYAAAAGYKLNSDATVILNEYIPTSVNPINGNYSQPKRPLSAYNMFFHLERRRLLEINCNNDDFEDFIKRNHHKLRPFSIHEVAVFAKQHRIESEIPKPKRKHRKTHGKIGFTELARTIAQRWKSMTMSQKSVFTGYFAVEMNFYKRALELYKVQNNTSVTTRIVDDATSVCPLEHTADRKYEANTPTWKETPTTDRHTSMACTTSPESETGFDGQHVPKRTDPMMSGQYRGNNTIYFPTQSLMSHNQRYMHQHNSPPSSDDEYMNSLRHRDQLVNHHRELRSLPIPNLRPRSSQIETPEYLPRTCTSQQYHHLDKRDGHKSSPSALKYPNERFFLDTVKSAMYHDEIMDDMLIEGVNRLERKVLDVQGRINQICSTKRMIDRNSNVPFYDTLVRAGGRRTLVPSSLAAAVATETENERLENITRNRIDTGATGTDSMRDESEVDDTDTAKTSTSSLRAYLYPRWRNIRSIGHEKLNLERRKVHDWTTSPTIDGRFRPPSPRKMNKTQYSHRFVGGGGSEIHAKEYTSNDTLAELVPNSSRTSILSSSRWLPEYNQRNDNCSDDTNIDDDSSEDRKFWKNNRFSLDEKTYDSGTSITTDTSELDLSPTGSHKENYMI